MRLHPFPAELRRFAAFRLLAACGGIISLEKGLAEAGMNVAEAELDLAESAGPEEPAPFAPRRGFTLGALVALPLAILLWALIFWVAA
jgi:hypothetical protein